MMTSVTLPSSSGPIHGGYSAINEEPSAGDSDIETSRPVKRCLAAPLVESCKKRRKQSTPVRISAADSDPNPSEGKLPVPSPELEVNCPICHLVFKSMEHLETHVKTEHATVECKKEPEDIPISSTDSPETPIELTNPRPDLPWMTDLQNKEWMSPNLLPFSPANHMFMTLSQFPQPDAVPPRQTIRIFNPDAYCELCNKEFCNKYFLKTHKANKHGIYSDPPTSDPVSGTVTIPSYATNIKLPVPVPSVDVAPVKIETKSQSSVVNPFSDLFTSPFSNKAFPKVSKSLVPASLDQESVDNSNPLSSNGLTNGEADRVAVDEPRAEESCSPRTVQLDAASVKSELIDQDGMYYTSPSKMSPGQQREHDLSNRLRRIGVMNPKAFCEICCKEYCNKYFLRTHKMKRHGIYIPDDGKDKDFKMDSFGNMTWSQNTQTSPLNLIMGEQSNTGSYSDRKTSSPADISCELCGIKFQNASLAQLHNVSMHSKIHSNVQETSNSNSEEEKVVDHTNTPEKPLNANDTISEDLQKLQTMILQLNDLDVNKATNTCNACSKEFENRYFLHAHMMTEHGLLLDDMADNDKSCEAETSINNNTMCDLCGKDFQNVQEMKKHIMEYHSNNETNPETKDEFNGFTMPEKGTSRTVTTGQLAERRASMTLTPTSSYCEICNKELCNKYFMKTHMQRMHGIEIENGAQIGGVICDICNKELCSKYFLRVHKHNTHGIVEYGASLLQPRKEEPPALLPAETDTALKPTDLADLSHRYFTHFTEVCTICSRRFRSTKWLKAHLLSDHGQAGVDKWAELEQQLQQSMNQHTKSSTPKNSSQGERVSPTLKIPNSSQENQNQSKVGIQNVLSSIFGADESNAKTYHCSYCPFTTPVLPFLFVHERSHSMQSEGENVLLKCPVCAQSFLQAELLQHHMFSQHPFLPLPPFFNGNVEPQGEISKEPSECAEEADDGGSSCDATKQGAKSKKVKRKFNHLELSPEVGQSLREVAKRSQLPASYALPQHEESSANTSAPSYIMQAFLLEEPSTERRFVPSLVFLPVLQKQSAPLTVTFTLTPA